MPECTTSSCPSPTSTARSQWYASRLGYQVVIEFREPRPAHGGVDDTIPTAGPGWAWSWTRSGRSASAGFDYFSIGVPDRDAMEALAAHLTGLGEAHAGVQFATIGWILPMLHDPDGHEVRFYSMESHTEIDPAAPLVIDDADRERAGQARASGSPPGRPRPPARTEAAP